jgi:hypothetical protein
MVESSGILLSESSRTIGNLYVEEKYSQTCRAKIQGAAVTQALNLSVVSIVSRNILSEIPSDTFWLTAAIALITTPLMQYLCLKFVHIGCARAL